MAYDAAKVLADALKRAGTTDSAKLRDAINATKNFAGVTGTISLDGDRNAVKPAVVLALDPAAGAFKFRETIAPEGMAATTSTAANSNAVATAGEEKVEGLPTPGLAANNANSTPSNTNTGNANAKTGEDK